MKPASRPATPNAMMRVLIADDAPETRRSIELILSLAPDVELVGSAANGREAVALAAAQRPDIALVDVNMPEMNGIEAIRQMRARRPELVCIIISAEKDALTLKQAVDAGIAAYLIKPFTAEDVLSILEKSRSIVLAQRAQAAGPPPRPSRRQLLEEAAAACIKVRRTDDLAVKVLETLAAEPDCPRVWLTHLAIIYALRGDWGKLTRLAAYLERRQEKP
ncbi:MAG TPA: response regulator [Anaerolineae bacterium]|nr:response regulator [Anaerolineae bacterium]HXK43969.1 response regulator [Anaerolineae bacterium]